MLTVTQERVHLTMSTDQLHAVDEWRRGQPDLPSRAEAIRRIVFGNIAPTPGPQPVNAPKRNGG